MKKKKSYLKNSLLNSLQLYPTFPSSIGLSLMWTIGPGWDLDDLNNKQIQLKEKKYLSKIAFHKIITSNIKKVYIYALSQQNKITPTTLINPKKASWSWAWKTSYYLKNENISSVSYNMHSICLFSSKTGIQLTSILLYFCILTGDYLNTTYLQKQ